MITDQDQNDLVTILRNGTHLCWFNAAECLAVLKFIEENGYTIAKAEPVKIAPVEAPLNAAVDGADAPDNPEPLKVAKPVKAKPATKRRKIKGDK